MGAYDQNWSALNYIFSPNLSAMEGPRPGGSPIPLCQLSLAFYPHEINFQGQRYCKVGYFNNINNKAL